MFINEHKLLLRQKRQPIHTLCKSIPLSISEAYFFSKKINQLSTVLPKPHYKKHKFAVKIQY
ncbi:hypothetical protein VIBHAR_06956 [Vibrio campbellii ATCC BAA-1116]|uniref:Uncharacterized protein n=1 Tax=Vibrio campbellii (strain ATCC BAA-1116) TaxID=2902295 RepID=A7N612_VIBC1|nr:hypothetical protein VIBHAR_06956 [Vibrio campbellii ATCC BAA-1116]